MIDENLEYIFNMAIKKANEKKHEYLTLENVLLALLQDALVLEVLSMCGADCDVLKSELNNFLDNDGNFSILSDDEIRELNDEQFKTEELKRRALKNGIMYQPELSLALQRVIQRAALHVQSAGKNRINGVNLLVAMYSERESYVVYLLEKLNISRLNIVERIAHGIDKPKTSFVPEENEGGEKIGTGPEKNYEKKSSGPKILKEYTENLNEMVQLGKIDPIIGREDEMRRIIQILCRRRKNNPLIVGDAGVGKTALVHGLAWAIEKNEVPSALKNTTIFSLDMVSLLAGTKFRGEFEERLKWVIQGLQEVNKDNGGSILFIDEIHTVIGAGATTSGSLDASNLLKPALVSGEIRCMGSTTFKEYRKFMEKDQALVRRFQKLEIDEPSVDDTIKIIEGLKSKYEDHHGVLYSTPIIKAAVNLSNKYITDRKLPDKAIDVIDEAGAHAQLKRGAGNFKKSKITMQNIENIVSIMAKIPKKSVTSSEKDKLKNLERDLKLLIFGQDQAVDRVVQAIQLSRSGLVSSERPIASFLFTGPTGVGKTELAKQLAFNLGIHFERFDMSEYMEKHSVSKLIGAPPGYVGFDQGGKLTDTINKYPHCVLLLDEIEKAHPDIFNILLQVMDYGRLTDSNGRNSDFKNVILIMTSNAGAKELEASSIGLGGQNVPKGLHNKQEKALKDFFTPEFRNRLDSIIHFNKLSHMNIEKIVSKFLLELETLLFDKKVELQVDPEVYPWIGKVGHDEKLGARPIARMIDDNIKKVLSQEILFGKLEKGGKVHIQLKDDQLHFEFVSR